MSAEDCEVRWIGRQTAVAMPAEIDVANADEIQRALVSAASLGAPVLIVDMSGTTFCDSARVQAIIAAHKQAAAADTQLRLVAPAVMRILTLVGVGQLVPPPDSGGGASWGTCRGTQPTRTRRILTRGPAAPAMRVALSYGIRKPARPDRKRPCELGSFRSTSRSRISGLLSAATAR